MPQLAPPPIVVYIPGRIIKRHADDSVSREAAQPAGLMLTEQEAARVLQLDIHNKGETAIYQALYRYRRKGWLRAVKRGHHLHYPTAEVLRCSQLMVEGLSASDRRAMA